MSHPLSDSNSARTRKHCLTEPEFWVLLLLACVIYLPRLHLPPLRGEETRRAMVGINMRESGDWIVPREQGTPFYMSSRPPLQSWCMTGIAALRGSFDVIAIRLPSVISLLLLLSLVYAYTRNFAGPSGAFTAGIAYATMMQVLELGRTGETDLMFALFVSAALLFWHWGYSQKWNPLGVWCLSYAAAALGTMTKGPQAPVYFVASVGVHLLLMRDWWYAISVKHLAGMLVYCLIVGAWLVPFASELGLPGVRHVFAGDVLLYGNLKAAAIIKHLSLYPLEIFACCFPWTLFLINYLFADFRRTLGPTRPAVLFLVGALAITFPTVWFIPGARSRFFMSLYPCIAILAGLAVDRLQNADLPAWIRAALVRFTTGFALVMILLGPALLIFAWASAQKAKPIPMAPSYAVAISLLIASTGLSIITFQNRKVQNAAAFLSAFASIGLFIGGLFVVLVVNDSTARSSRMDLTAAAAIEKLPPDVKLVSLGTVHHNFAYQYYFHRGQLIEKLPDIGDSKTPPAGVTFFCTNDARFAFDDHRPFPCEILGIVNCERFKRETPGTFVTVIARVK